MITLYRKFVDELLFVGPFYFLLFLILGVWYEVVVVGLFWMYVYIYISCGRYGMMLFCSTTLYLGCGARRPSSNGPNVP